MAALLLLLMGGADCEGEFVAVVLLVRVLYPPFLPAFFRGGEEWEWETDSSQRFKHSSRRMHINKTDTPHTHTHRAFAAVREIVKYLNSFN